VKIVKPFPKKRESRHFLPEEVQEGDSRAGGAREYKAGGYGQTNWGRKDTTGERENVV